ncbi:MAG TPA: BON domain-containing protein [Gemmatimonadaceae bacterium]|nr:BON domain-containing protein [Gemmatimonadaceae bacterium]
MARDFEDIFRLDELSDEELRALVRDQLADYDSVDADNILVTAANGEVVLAGRVGTEEERRVAERILADVIGLKRYRNDLVVDEIRRDEEPEAVDDHLANAREGSGEPIGQRPDNVNDEAEHLEEDLNARMFGTHDVQSAIERGTAWIPPDEPTPEGFEPDPRGEI